MKLNYNLDLSDGSVWLVNTPSEAAKRLPFYMIEYGHFLSRRDYFTERTGKKAYYLLYTVSGTGYLRIPEGEFTLQPGSVVLINCEKYQYYRTDSDDIWENQWLHFSGRAAREYFRLVNPGGVMLLQAAERDYFSGLMTACRDFFTPGDIRTNIGASLHVTQLLSCLIGLRLGRQPVSAKPDADFDMEKTISYMRRHFAGRITVDMLAQNAMMSKYYFIKRFGAAAGTSPYRYLLNLRVSRAKELLVTTAISVTDIAAAVGFAGTGNFIKAFRKATGRTPTEYRKSM